MWFKRYLQRDNIEYGTFNVSGISCKVTGAIWASGVVTTTSDKRIKNNITALNDGDSFKIINKLNPCKQNYIDTTAKGNHDVIGFISEKVQEIIPYAVLSNQEDYIPDLYQICSVDGSNITTSNIHNYIVSDKPKFFGEDNKDSFILLQKS